MTTSDKRGDSRSGPCLTRQCERCTYAGENRARLRQPLDVPLLHARGVLYAPQGVRRVGVWPLLGEPGSDERLTLDHIKHWSRGGTDTVGNLRTLCGSCNSQRKDRTDEEWLGRAL